MDPFVQTRTSRGQIPCRQVQPVADGEPCSLDACSAFAFDLMPPTELAAADVAQHEGDQSAGLLDLAMCVSQQERRIEVFRDALFSFAQKTGPLFGASSTEPFAAWSSAALAASLALVLQELVNGSMPVQGAVILGNLVKRRVSNPQTGTEFDLLTISRLLEAEYARELCGSAFVRREKRGDRINYTFLLSEDMGDGGSAVDLIVASFTQEMTRSDYLMLSQALEFGDKVDAETRERLGIDLASDEKSAYGFAADVELLGAEQPVDEGDLPALASAVHTLVAAHLRDARVDVFTADEKTGHLRFGSYLGWLWYDFSCKLDVARIGYCARCRKPFSLVGHRGVDRRFCSEACKTAAKNERFRKHRDALRRDFLAGEEVAVLARRYFEGEKRVLACAKVRKELETWPTLKHEVDDAIGRDGWRAPLLARCKEERLDLERILPSKRREQLRQMARTQS